MKFRLDTSELLKSQNKPRNLLKVFLTRYLPRSSTHIEYLKPIYVYLSEEGWLMPKCLP